MKITYFHQHFKINAGGTRSYEFSKFLINRGHQVTMITGNDIGRNLVDGISIRSTRTKYNHNFSFFRRIIAFIHFMIKSTIIGLKEKNQDIIYATSTPLTIGFPALIVSKLKRKKLVFEVRDVWPDVPIELGYIKSSFLKKILFSFEKLIYKNSSHIVVLSKGMKENLVKKGIDSDKISIITNLSMNSYYDNTDISERITFKDKLLCIHPGTMGVVNGLEFILDVAEQFPDNDILYLLIGEGNQKQKLINRIKTNHIKNIIIQDSVSKSQIIKKIREADIGIMTVANYPILEDNSANKFFDYLAAGLPVVINYEGWQKEVLELHKAGRGFSYSDKKGFYSFLVEMKHDKQLRREYGENAKKLAVEKYDSQLLALKLEGILENIVFS